MGLFRRAERSSREMRRHPASLTVGVGKVASVRRYDLTAKKDVDALLKAQQKWQESAWYYFDEVGELKDAVRFVENAFRRIRLYASFQRDPDAEPIPVADAVAQSDEEAEDEAGNERSPEDYLTQAQADEVDAILSSFAARDGGQQALMGKMGTNVFLVGEVYIVNRETPTRQKLANENPDEVPTSLDWEIRSRDELKRSQSSQTAVEVIDVPGQQDGVVLGPDAYVERLWRKHGRYSGWADSNVRAAIGTLEEIDLLNRLARASTRSRILAGILTMPDEMDFGDEDQPMDGEAARRSVGFDREIEVAMAAVIEDESDANSVAPLALRGPAEFLDAKFTHMIEIPRRYGVEEREQHKDAIAKLGRTIELPIERLVGLEGVNHWGAWLISEDTYSAYIQPLVGIVTEGLAYGFLRPMLAEGDAPWPEDLIEKIVVSADASQLVARPDRGKVATEGYGLDVPALSGDAWRKANSFGDDDAPSDEELARHVAFKTGVDQVTAAKILAAQEIIPEELAAEMQAVESPGFPPSGTPGEPGQEQTPAPAGGEGETPHGAPQGGQEASRVAVAASAAPQRRAWSNLSATDRVLAERVQVAADAAMGRAMEKGGARLRTLAMKVPTGRDILRSRDISNEDVPAALGAELTLAVTKGALLYAGMFDHLRPQWDAWVAQAQQDGLDAAAGAGDLTAQAADQIAARQADERAAGWAWLLTALLAQATANATKENLPPAQGEQNPLLVVPPGLLREALAIAGGADAKRGKDGAVTNPDGTPVGGVATGKTIGDAFSAAGAGWVGYEWVHGDPKEPFEPHLALDGVFISDWSDGKLAVGGDWPQVDGYFPGDHLWCTCSFTPVSDSPEEG